MLYKPRYTNHIHSRLDEQAQRQREREQEAEARIPARRAERAQGPDMSSRTFSRDRPGVGRSSQSPAAAGGEPTSAGSPSTSAADAPVPSGRVPLRLQPRGGGTANKP